MKITPPLTRRGRPPKKGGGKLGRNEALQARLDTKLKFTTELAARAEKRTISSTIEIAIEEFLNGFIVKAPIKVGDQSLQQMPILDLVDAVWDFDEATRFLQLAQVAPSLLSLEEKAIWNVMQKEKDLFYINSSSSNETIFNLEFIQLAWDELLKLDPEIGMESIDFKEKFIATQKSNKPEKIATLRKALYDLYVSDFDF